MSIWLGSFHPSRVDNLAWSTTYKGTPDSETFHRVHCIACEVYFPNMHCREPEGASKAIITSTVTGSKKLQIFISFSVHFQISGDIRIGNNLASVNLDLLRRHLIHHPIIQSQISIKFYHHKQTWSCIVFPGCPSRTSIAKPTTSSTPNLSHLLIWRIFWKYFNIL